MLYTSILFACRRCHRLAYASTRVNAEERAALRAERLGWEPGILNGAGLRRKGMQRRTYERLRTLHEGYVSKAVAAVSARLEKAGLELEGACVA